MILCTTFSPCSIQTKMLYTMKCTQRQTLSPKMTQNRRRNNQEERRSVYKGHSVNCVYYMLSPGQATTATLPFIPLYQITWEKVISVNSLLSKVNYPQQRSAGAFNPYRENRNRLFGGAHVTTTNTDLHNILQSSTRCAQPHAATAAARPNIYVP